ncbi:MAG: hypothetical protein A2177_06165 [Spirochaetes bacterium RBG_13_68_11]|nr:MAG: hypothetical protein A2177_06165 [Spirochaetes bacterium RBG_13_68_11]
MEEHFKEHCNGAYHLSDPEQLKNGKRYCIWPGSYYRTNRKTPANLVDHCWNLALYIIELVNGYRFYQAPLSATNRIFERIEAALASHLYNQPWQVGAFQEEGILKRLSRHGSFGQPV